MSTKINQQINDILLSRREFQIAHFTWKEEQELLNIIRSGQPGQLPTNLNNVRKAIDERHGGGICSQDTFRHNIYSLVAAITLFSRAAIEGGVPDDIAYAMCDSYIMSCDRCQTLDDIFTLYKTALYSFIEAVCQYQTRAAAHSPVTEAIINYITIHLHENISLEMIARHMHLSVSYCGHRFKADTGHSIFEYIKAERIRSAENLLKYSDFSITEISEYLGFANQSYFTKVFRELNGISPLKYRKKYKPENFYISSV